MTLCKILSPTAIQLAEELENDPITGRLGFVLLSASQLRELHYAKQELLEALKTADWYISVLEPFVYDASEKDIVHEDHAVVKAAIEKYAKE
jgi:vacuolar-type H+-ATPase subunit C/Vma6